MMYLYINYIYSKYDYNVVLGSNENDLFLNFFIGFFW